MAKKRHGRFKAAVIGVSTGGVEVLKKLLGALPANFQIPLLVVAHISPDASDGLPLLLDDLCAIRVKEADDSETVLPGTVYIAPPNYHLQLERGGKISLSVDPPVNYARPSVDVLFETAASAMGDALIGIVLTGAGFDGAQGLKSIAQKGGVTAVQDPADAVADSMPRSAIAAVTPDHILPLEQVAELLIKLAAE